ncbi:hypothetical protein M758_8G172300 [Ceratodon purpureus]|nr:hypothetical protein M758_8G172300 [Ceratodon purpureus]
MMDLALNSHGGDKHICLRSRTWIISCRRRWSDEAIQYTRLHTEVYNLQDFEAPQYHPTSGDFFLIFGYDIQTMQTLTK